MRRVARSAPGPQPDPARSYAEDTVYGRCEKPGCGRHARATCASCGGEYCLRHDRHPEHDASATTG